MTSATARRRALHAYVTLMRAVDGVTRATHGHLADVGLTDSRFAVLEALFHLGPLSQRDLGRKILSSPGNLTTVVDHLERDGLVERRADQDDRRVKRVHPTRAGRALIARVFPRHAEGIACALQALSAAEQTELARLCKKLGHAQGTKR